MIRGSSTLVGWLVWLLAAVALPAPVLARVFLLAPLVIVPRLLPRVDVPGVARLAGWPAVGAALPLCFAFAMPAGAPAAVLTAPWILLAFVALGWTAKDALPRLPRVSNMGAAAAVGFLVVGASFVTVERLGLQPLRFSPTIILLTAVHFHFAGFGLLVIASGLARRVRSFQWAVVGLVAGMPITALGFVADSPWIGALGAIVVGASGLGVGYGLLTATVATASGFERLAWRVAGIGLLLAMPLGIGWSVALLIGGTLLPLDSMVRTHGFLNAAAVTLVAMADRGLAS
jgi:YndJ-like protein